MRDFCGDIVLRAPANVSRREQLRVARYEVPG